MPGELWIFDDGRVMGGGQLGALRLARHLTAHGRDVQIACPAESRLAAACRADGIPTVDVRFPDPSPRSLPAAPGVIRRLRPLLRRLTAEDVVLAASPRASAWLVLASRGLRLRAPLVHLLVEQDTAERRSALLVLSRFGGVVALGANAARTYGERLPGVEVFKANIWLLPEQLAGAERGAPQTPPRLAVLARLIPEKGLVELVGELAADPAAWAALSIAGASDDPAYERRLRERIAALPDPGRVRLLGHADPRAVLREADALVVPSTGREGQPTVIVEALAAGIPAIVRKPVWSEDFAGLPVVTFDDARSLAAALRALPAERADRAELERRFGPEQALDAIQRAAASARS